MDIDLNKGVNKNDNGNAPSEKTEEYIKNIDLRSLISDIENSIKIKESILEKEISKIQGTEIPISKTITETGETLLSINLIKNELCKLPLNPCEREYFDNSVNPLLVTFYELAAASNQLASSADVLTNSNMVFRKKSKIKDTLDLVYDINKKAEEVYEVLSKRIDKLLYNK